MVDAPASKKLRIGIDVGGTNTDGVILDPSLAAAPSKGILAWHKAPTTASPGDGINAALTSMFASADISPDSIASITIGTTHFVNAVVERDASRLSRVAVLRLCGPFSKHAPPCIDWPDDLKDLILGYYALLKGGLEVDGHLISDINPDEIKLHCDTIRKEGIRSIVVNGVFSPIDTVERQEERAADIIRQQIPGAEVVCSKDVANIGFLERENAAILNAAISGFARRTIHSFREGARRLGLNCPVFVTQNDGTILAGEAAARLPIRTFSSGPTNSMRGAAFLAASHLNEAIMVVDIGGTTTDVGLLQTNGFPRQQAAYSDLAGVRMNFSCPDIKSIGLGGGSIVRRDGNLSVGPDSVGYKIVEEALVFGGTTLTATDCTVAANPTVKIGVADRVKGVLGDEEIAAFRDLVRRKLEKVIDTMKTSPEDVPVLLVGGGAVIAPDELKGASRVLKPEWSQVANAIGAAIARVSAVVDTVLSTEGKSTQGLLENMRKEVTKKAVAAGAVASSVRVVEEDVLPLPYIDHKSRFVVRAAGEFDFSRTDISMAHIEDATLESDGSEQITTKPRPALSTTGPSPVDLSTYQPTVKDRVWYITETDLNFLATGCYILGTGGGGSPYSQKLLLRQHLRSGAIVRVVHPQDLPDTALVGSGGGVGSPTVGIEKLAADEMVESQQELYALLTPQKPSHMIAIEVGGANGLQGMILGASTNMNLPAVDGDWMGRAYPTKWQTTPVVFNERSPIWSPVAMSDGGGNVVVMAKARSDHDVERVMRAALTQMGSQTAAADPPVSGEETKRWVVEHTLSQAWRIGRAVWKAREERNIGEVAERIVEECSSGAYHTDGEGERRGAKVLWKGKIVGVERRLRGGYIYGECFIEGIDNLEIDGDGSTGDGRFKGLVKIPFKNENIAVIKVSSLSTTEEHEDGIEKQEDVLAIVPDLITIIDSQDGEAIGTPEYRYGLLVVVLGIAASDKWTSSERGIKLGGPEAFGFGHLSYRPLGKFAPPRSVIDEFDGAAEG